MRRLQKYLTRSIVTPPDLYAPPERLQTHKEACLWSFKSKATFPFKMHFAVLVFFFFRGCEAISEVEPQRSNIKT